MIKKLTDAEADQLIEKESSGETLSGDQVISLFMYHGMSEPEAREAAFIASDEYGKPGKDGNVLVI